MAEGVASSGAGETERVCTIGGEGCGEGSAGEGCGVIVDGKEVVGVILGVCEAKCVGFLVVRRAVGGGLFGGCGRWGGGGGLANVGGM